MPDKKPIPFGTIAIFALWIGLLGLVYFVLKPSQTPVPPELMAVLRPQPKPLQSFALVDQNSQSFTREAFEDRWSFVFFGYTYCPDICPMTLSTLTAVLNELQRYPDAASGVQVIFVSVDPERDTPEMIGNYMEYFGKDFLGVTGTGQEIARVALQFGAAYVKEAERAPGEYLISHASSVFLVDPRARLLAGFSPPHDAATIAEQFRQIRSLD